MTAILIDIIVFIDRFSPRKYQVQNEKEIMPKANNISLCGQSNSLNPIYPIFVPYINKILIGMPNKESKKGLFLNQSQPFIN